MTKEEMADEFSEKHFPVTTENIKTALKLAFVNGYTAGYWDASKGELGQFFNEFKLT